MPVVGFVGGDAFDVLMVTVNEKNVFDGSCQGAKTRKIVALRLET